MKYPHTPTLEDEKFLRRFRSEMRFVQHPVVSKALRLAVPKLGTDFSGRRRDVQEDGTLGPEYVPDMPKFTPPSYTIGDALGEAGPALRAAVTARKRRRRRKPKAVTA